MRRTGSITPGDRNFHFGRQTGWQHRRGVEGPWGGTAARGKRQPKAHGASRWGLSRCPSRTLRRVVGASGSRLRRISTLPGHRGDGGRSIGIRG